MKAQMLAQSHQNGLAWLVELQLTSPSKNLKAQGTCCNRILVSDLGAAATAPHLLLHLQSSRIPDLGAEHLEASGLSCCPTACDHLYAQVVSWCCLRICDQEEGTPRVRPGHYSRSKFFLHQRTRAAPPPSCSKTLGHRQTCNLQGDIARTRQEIQRCHVVVDRISKVRMVFAQRKHQAVDEQGLCFLHVVHTVCRRWTCVITVLRNPHTGTPGPTFWFQF
jgi:hypothetical protein